MRRTNDEPSLSQILGAPRFATGIPRRPRTSVARRATANLALVLGVMATSVSLGVLVGQLGRALIGG
ncbi:hypothetical protein [Phenylobacterium sp.]|uniref:hypothetical protein n=1 Tax=Phenylobacterium sp. TaxID=1871053 RepID=UPI0030F481D3